MRAGIDVTTSQETDLRSRSDIAQLDFAISQSRVLVTHDDDFLILNSQGIEHCGIVYCRKDTKSIGYMIRMMILLYEVATMEELKNRVEFL
jgi:predicted nuclease of predicted toxin-antitoxin system